MGSISNNMGKCGFVHPFDKLLQSKNNKEANQALVHLRTHLHLLGLLMIDRPDIY
jgi:hypothetical protein